MSRNARRRANQKAYLTDEERAAKDERRKHRARLQEAKKLYGTLTCIFRAPTEDSAPGTWVTIAQVRLCSLARDCDVLVPLHGHILRANIGLNEKDPSVTVDIVVAIAARREDGIDFDSIASPHGMRNVYSKHGPVPVLTKKDKMWVVHITEHNYRAIRPGRRHHLGPIIVLK